MLLFHFTRPVHLLWTYTLLYMKNQIVMFYRLHVHLIITNIKLSLLSQILYYCPIKFSVFLFIFSNSMCVVILLKLYLISILKMYCWNGIFTIVMTTDKQQIVCLTIVQLDQILIHKNDDFGNIIFQWRKQCSVGKCVFIVSSFMLSNVPHNTPWLFILASYSLTMTYYVVNFKP